jgi:hypothetical protein
MSVARNRQHKARLMRGMLTLLILLPLAVGLVVGFVVAPVVIGFMISYEFLAQHVHDAAKRLDEKRV